MKKYKLLQKLPWAKVGTIYKCRENHRDTFYYPEKHSSMSTYPYEGIPHLYTTDLEWFEPIEERYRPEKGESYWTFDIDGKYRYKTAWQNSFSDVNRFDNNAVFEHQQEVDVVLARVKKTLLDYRKELADE